MHTSFNQKSSDHPNLSKEEEQNSHTHFQISRITINKRRNVSNIDLQEIQENTGQEGQDKNSSVYEEKEKYEAKLEEEIQSDQKNISMDHEGRKGKYKKILLISIFVLLLATIITLSLLLALPSKSESQDKHILERKYNEGIINKIGYSIHSTMEGHDVRVNYTVFCGIINKTKDGVEFAGSFQKRSEEIFIKNETVVTYFDNSSIFQNLIKTGKDNDLQIPQPQEDEEIQEKPFNVFKFRLALNGTIQWVTFPKNMDSEILGLLRSFIQLLSPELSVQLYSEKSSKYGFSKEGNKIVLKKEEESSCDQYHKTKETIRQKSVFSEEGNLEQSSLFSRTIFDAEATQDGKSNLIPQLFSEQEAKLVILQTIKTKYIGKFSSYIKKYEENLSAYSMSIKDIIQYLIEREGNNDMIEDEEINDGKIRMLEQKEDEISFIKYDREIIILNSKVMNYDIKAYGYIKLNVKFNSNPENKYEKSPKFDVQVGTTLYVGKKKYSTPLIDFSKNHPVLTLKYTLSMIEEVMKKKQKKFIGKIDNIKDLAINNDFIPLSEKTKEVGNQIEKVVERVKEEERKRNPSVFNQILSYLSNVYSTLKNEQKKVLNPSSQFTNGLVGDLRKFGRNAYGESYKNFNKVKEDLKNIKFSSSYFFDENMREFKGFKLSEISQTINDLLPSKLQQKNKKEMQKTSDVTKYLQYVEKEGKSYEEALSQTYSSTKDDYLDFTEGTIDLFIEDKVKVAKENSQLVTSQLSNTKKEIQTLGKKLISIDSVVYKISNHFWGLRYWYLQRSYYYLTFSNYLSELYNLAYGIRNERGECCKKRLWWCHNKNDARHDQHNEINHFNNFRSNIESRFINMAKATEAFMNNLNSIMKSGYHINTKFYKIKQAYNAIYKTDLDSVVNLIRERRDFANYIRTKVECGGVANLDAYRAKLNSLYYLAYYFRSYYNSFNNKYNQIISGSMQYNPLAFSQIENYFKFSSASNSFLSSFENSHSKTKKSIEYFHQILSKIQPESFLNSLSSSSQKILRSHQQTLNNFSFLCVQKASQKQKIDKIRGQYSGMWRQTMKLPSNFLNNEVYKMREFLLQGSKKSFSSYQKLDFCSDYKSYKKKMGNLEDQLDEFTLLKNIFNQFQQKWKQITSSMAELNKQVSQFKIQFQSIYYKTTFKSFIQKVYNSALKSRSLVDEIGLTVSQLKEQAKKVSIFKLSSKEKLLAQLQHFSSSEFKLSSGTMFKNIINLKNRAEKNIDLLDEDVLVAAASTRKAKQFLQYTIKGMEKGITKVKDDFNKVCDKFANVNINSNMKELKEMQEEFEDSLKIDNILTNQASEKEKIEDDFDSYDFKNSNLRKIKKNSMNSINEVVMVTKMSKRYLKYRANDYKKRASKLVKKMEIENIVKVDELASFIEDKENNMQKQFSSSLEWVNKFIVSVKDDFRTLFDFQKQYNEMRKKAENDWESSTKEITKQIRNFIKSFDQYCDFLTTLKVSRTYRSMMKVEEQFKINFDSYFDKASSNVTQIQKGISTLKGKEGDLMSQLSLLRKSLQNSDKNVKNKIQWIKNKEKELKDEFSLLENMIFVDIEEEMGNNIKQRIVAMKNSMNSIFQNELKSIKTVSEKRLASELSPISSLIYTAKNLYDQSYKIYETYQKKLSDCLKKINKFIEDEEMGNVKKLKAAQLFIKRKTDHEEPLKKAILFKDQYTDYNMPIIDKYKECVVTAIGTYITQLSLNYTVNLTSEIALQNVRNVEIQNNFSASVTTQLSIKYGMGSNVEMHISNQTDAVKEDIEPALHLYNIIPMQLVTDIEGMEELEKENELEVTFTIDLVEEKEEMEEEGGVLYRRRVEEEEVAKGKAK